MVNFSLFADVGKTASYLCRMPSTKITASRALLLHYLLMGYVIVQFIWWAFLIYDLNTEIIEQQTVIAQVEARQFGTPLTHLETKQKLLNQKIYMIVGEGSVFMLILVIGGYYIRKFILRESKLARQERNFLLATTHELNSPIAAVKLNLQTLLKRELPPEKAKRVLENALQSTLRLEGLSSNILLASRLDSQRLALQYEWMDASALLHAIVSQHEALKKEGQEIIVSAPPFGEIHTDRPAFESIAGNLISNALKYAPKGSGITVSLQFKNHNAILSVADNGPGIPADEKQQVFKKFYRLENEETRSAKGTGLGLFLVAQLTRLMSGTVTVSANTPSGSIFEITLPQKTK